MQVGELVLERDQRMVGAGNIARAASTGAHAGRRLNHGTDHLRMLAHSKVIVRAPYDDVARTLRRVPDREWKPTGETLEIGKNPIPAFIPQPVQRAGEKGTVVHDTRSRSVALAASGGGRTLITRLLLEEFHSCRGDIRR